VRNRVAQDRGGDVGDVVLRDGGDATVARRTTDDAVRTGHQRDEVGVQVVAQEGEGEPALTDVLLGVPVIAGQGERRVRRGAVEGNVDEVRHAGGRRGVDEGAVLVDPVRGL
jgi:hypothetical protein